MSTAGRSKKPSPKSRSGGPKKNEGAISRPFEPAVLEKAARLAREYALVIEPHDELGYFGRTVEMPYVMGDGKTVAQCAEQVIEATIAAIATMLEDGQRPPAPASEKKRDQQVNLRLTAEEKLRLEAAASRDGFRSLSDYLRTAGLDRAG